MSLRKSIGVAGLILGATTALTSCASPEMAKNGAVGVVNSTDLAPPTEADLSGFFRPQLIGAGDTLQIDVVGLPELSREVRVDSAGFVTVPLAGKVNVISKDTAAIARDVEASLRASYVRDPEVIVSVSASVSQVVTVEGEVEKPGIYPVIGDMTLMRSIARAEGLSDYANSRRVIVFRTVGGQKMAALYDLQAIQLGYYEDPQLYARDLVVVDESRARRLFPLISSAAGVLVAPVVAILNNSGS